MQLKYLAFFIFLWFFGMLFGSIYEQQNFETYSRYTTGMSSGTTSMTSRTTFNYLFDFTNSKKETTVGSIFWKLAQPDYYLAWMSMLTLDFSFLKSIQGDHTTKETIQSYLFKALGIIGIVCFVLMFIDVIQGFIPST